MFCRPFPRAALLLLAIGTAGARCLAAEDFSHVRAKIWNTDDGLPASRIACLKQTSDGYLWVGTWSGLARFDGHHFTVFDRYNSPEMVSETINALAEDRDGTLWAGTRDGLVSWRDHRFTHVPVPTNWPECKVWRVVPSRLGGLWLQCGELVARFQAGQFSRPYQPVGSGINHIVGLEESSDGGLNIYTDSALCKVGPDLGELRTNYVANTTWGGCLAGRAEAPGCFLLGTRNGLRRLDPSGPAVADSAGLGDQAVNGLFLDRSGRLWASAHPGGLFYRDKDRWQNVPLGLEVNDAMERDTEGSFWIGSDQGLIQVLTQPVRVYTTREGLAGDNVLSVCEGLDGAIWVGTHNGLSCIRRGKVVPLATPEPMPDYEDRQVWPSKDGGVWIGKMGQGVLEFSHGEYSSRAAVGVLSGSPNVLYGDSAGRVWVGLSPGAICFEPPEQRLVVRDKVHDIHCFLEEPDGAFWVGTRGGGLMRWQQGQSTAFTMKDGLSYSNVWCLHRDNGGGLWIGTDNGLTRYKNGKFFPFYVRHGLLENTINSIVEDAVGNLWLGGLRGIYRVERSQLDAVADGRATKVQPFAVGTADGMASAETNGGENQPAGWKARDGLLWFPTIRGLVAFDPKSFPRHELPPPVLLESVKADGEIIAGDPDIEEPGGSSKPVVAPDAARPSLNSRPSTSYRSLSDAHVLEFKYTANSFIDSRRVRFRYRLLGTDRDWHEQTTERTARYSHLRPGQYRFEVTAANHHNTWNPAPAAFSFYVAPHWWQTATFYALCAAGVVGLAAAIQAYRLYWQHRLLKLEHQRELANERARIARDLHDDLGTGLTGLALELDVAGRDPAGAPSLSDRLRATARRARDMAERMREVVWTVNPSCDTVSSLADFLEQQVGQFLRADGVQVRLDFPEDIPPLPLGAEARHQLALSMREGLANVIRHAQATEVRVSLAIENSTLVLRIRDNGHGFAPAEREGHGLANMRQRLKRIGGTFECRSVPGEGTTLTFYLPL